MYNTVKKNIFSLEYNFFKYEDKSDKNIYPLKKLKQETRKMEKTKGFKKLIKKIENVIIIVIIILISVFFIITRKIEQIWRALVNKHEKNKEIKQ